MEENRRHCRFHSTSGDTHRSVANKIRTSASRATREHAQHSNAGGLWTMPVLGGQVRRIGDIVAFDASWSPDGASIYYALRAVTSGSREAMEPRLGRFLPLTDEEEPNWIRFSPGGKLFRFDVLDEKHNTNSLWEARADGTGLRRLFSGDAWPNECCGAWTPDGKYFVFESTRGGTWNLWAVREKRDWWRKTNAEPVQLATGASNCAESTAEPRW